MWSIRLPLVQSNQDSQTEEGQPARLRTCEKAGGTRWLLLDVAAFVSRSGGDPGYSVIVTLMWLFCNVIDLLIG